MRRRMDREALERKKVAIERARKPLGKQLVLQTRHLHGLQGHFFMRTEDLLPQVRLGLSGGWCEAFDDRGLGWVHVPDRSLHRFY